uniref:Uncharacterized protein n=1 Tax=Arundo donax TaxID=35708 RepID=A0A0A9F4D8_ARUDO
MKRVATSMVATEYVPGGTGDEECALLPRRCHDYRLDDEGLNKLGDMDWVAPAPAVDPASTATTTAITAPPSTAVEASGVGTTGKGGGR